MRSVLLTVKKNMDQLLQLTYYADLRCLALHRPLHLFAFREHISTLSTGLPWVPDLHVLHVLCGLIGVMTVACSAPVILTHA